jgi:hypothetical protein
VEVPEDLAGQPGEGPAEASAEGPPPLVGDVEIPPDQELQVEVPSEDAPDGGFEPPPAGDGAPPRSEGGATPEPPPAAPPVDRPPEPPAAEGTSDVPPLPGEASVGGAQPVGVPPTAEVPPEATAGAPPPEAPPVSEPLEPPAYELAAAEVDLPPELYDEPLPYGAGSGTQLADAPSEEAPGPADHPAAGAPTPAVNFDLETDDSADEALQVKAVDGDDPGLLEQVAEVVGDLWDDAKDVVT